MQTAIQAPRPSEDFLSSQPCSSNDRLGTSLQSRPTLPMRIRLQRWAETKQHRAHTIACEFRSFLGRIQSQRTKTGYMRPMLYLKPALSQTPDLMSSASRASIRYIKSVEAEMPWASLFDMSLVMQGWAEGAAWCLRNSESHTTQEEIQAFTPPHNSNLDKGQISDAIPAAIAGVTRKDECTRTKL